MFISQTSKNAIRILSYLAKTDNKISTEQIASHLKISVKNVRKIIFLLLKAGFVNSIQGKNGGYFLVYQPQDIYIIQIIEAIDGLEKYNQCIFGYEECNEQNPCPLHYEWIKIKAKFMNFISSVNLEKIIENENLINSNVYNRNT